jgi:hypothetical protein
MSCEYWIFWKNGNHWIDRYLKSGYQHMFVISRDEYNWYLIDPLLDGLNFEILSFDPADAQGVFDKYLPGCHRVVYFKKLVKEKLSFGSICRPASCVELVKYIVGIKSYALTPYQLFKHILKYLNKKYKIKIIK